MVEGGAGRSNKWINFFQISKMYPIQFNINYISLF